MALANVACLLARQRKRVLMIDWDLEAPGLHRFFGDQLGRWEARESFDMRPGLIDMFWALAAALDASEPGDGRQDSEESAALIRNSDLRTTS